MGEYNRALGGGIRVIVGDCEYRLSYATLGIKADFEAWMEGRVLQAAYARKSRLPSDDYHGMLAAVFENVALEKFAWGSKHRLESIRSDAGAVELCRLLIQKYHNLDTAKVRELMLANVEGFAQAINVALGFVDTDPTKPPEAPVETATH